MEGYVYLGISCAPTGIEEKRGEVRPIFEFGPIIPNPFSEHLQICYSIAKQGKVSLKVYDYVGRMVTKLVDIEQEPGTYNINWDRVDDGRKRVKAGIYFIRLSADRVETRKLVIIR